MSGKKFKKFKVKVELTLVDHDGMIENGPHGKQAFEHMFKSAFMGVKTCEEIKVDVDEYVEEIKDKRVLIQAERRDKVARQRIKRAQAKSDKPRGDQSN